MIAFASSTKSLIRYSSSSCSGNRSIFRLYSSSVSGNESVDTSAASKISSLSLLKQRLKRVEGKSIKTNVDTATTVAVTLQQASVTYVNADNTINGDSDISTANSEFRKLGLIEDIIKGLSNQNLNIPTPVQRAVIPRLLTGENMVMAASTGSGKTLAFTLPAIQNMITQEGSSEYKRQTKRPRCLILVPTRELARQILSTIKMISHYSKISSCAVLGGEQYALQKKSLDRLVDIVVASPGRLIQHKEQGNVYLSQVTHVIIDEVDTMLTQGFGSDIRAVLRSVMARHKEDKESANAGTGASATVVGLASSSKRKKKEVQLIMATATLTKAVRSLLEDITGADSGFNYEFSDPTNATPRKDVDEKNVIPINIVEVDGVHRSLPHIKHNIEETKGLDKLNVLQTVINRHTPKKYRTLIFCNTVNACRAVEHFLNEADITSTSYHGDLNSKERESNLNKFRDGQEQYLVCSDIAARGLDIPEIDHVIMFDFPLNPVDYIHRAGRCGRAGRKGLVTALITKRDKILSDAIQGAIARGLPIDNLTSSKKDYQDRGKLAKIVGRKSKEEMPKKPRSSEFPIRSSAAKDKKGADGARGTASGLASRDSRSGTDRGSRISSSRSSTSRSADSSSTSRSGGSSSRSSRSSSSSGRSKAGAKR